LGNNPELGYDISHALLISMDILSNLSGIVADSSGINRGSVNLLIHVSHLLQEEHIISIQLIFVGVNHLVVVLEQSVLFFQSIGLFFVKLLLWQVDLISHFIQINLKTSITFPLAFALASSLSSIIYFLYSLSFCLIRLSNLGWVFFLAIIEIGFQRLIGLHPMFSQFFLLFLSSVFSCLFLFQLLLQGHDFLILFLQLLLYKLSQFLFSKELLIEGYPEGFTGAHLYLELFQLFSQFFLIANPLSFSRFNSL